MKNSWPMYEIQLTKKDFIITNNRATYIYKYPEKILKKNGIDVETMRVVTYFGGAGVEDL